MNCSVYRNVERRFVKLQAAILRLVVTSHAECDTKRVTAVEQFLWQILLISHQDITSQIAFTTIVVCSVIFSIIRTHM